jgi:hypothetical protein
MNIFEKSAMTSWANRKGFEKRGVKIRPAEGDHEIEPLHRQIRSMMHHIIVASFPCIVLISCHRFDEINRARP